MTMNRGVFVVLFMLGLLIGGPSLRAQAQDVTPETKSLYRQRVGQLIHEAELAAVTEPAKVLLKQAKACLRYGVPISENTVVPIAYGTAPLGSKMLVITPIITGHPLTPDMRELIESGYMARTNLRGTIVFADTKLSEFQEGVLVLHELFHWQHDWEDSLKENGEGSMLRQLEMDKNEVTAYELTFSLFLEHAAANRPALEALITEVAEAVDTSEKKTVEVTRQDRTGSWRLTVVQPTSSQLDKAVALLDGSGTPASQPGADQETFLAHGCFQGGG